MSVTASILRMRNVTDILPVAIAMMQNGCEIQLILMRRAWRIADR